MAPPDPPPPTGLRAIGRALRHRNYRLFFFGQGVSLVGSWLSKVAVSWLVYRLTGSAWMLGLVGFATQLPTFLFAPLGGVLVDRSNRHRVLVLTQALSMLQSALLAWFTLRGTIDIVHLVVLSTFQGMVSALETPARQAFVVEMVTAREDLPNAIALNSTMQNAARLIGPAVAAVLVGAVGEGWCFTIDAISYLAVLASLFAMTLPPWTRRPRATGGWTDLREGFRVVRESVAFRSILLLVALVSFAGVPYAVLMPLFATRVPGGGPHTLGLLMASVGAGAVVGALGLAARRNVIGLGRVIGGAALVFGTALCAFAFARPLWLAVPLLGLAGGGMMVQMAASNTMLQTIVDEDLRGRVMSFYAMSFFGMLPFGSLAAGWAAARFGAPATVLIGGVVTIAGGVVFLRRLPALRREVRPIYRRLGILPVVAEGIEQTAAVTAATTSA